MLKKHEKIQPSSTFFLEQTGGKKRVYYTEINKL